MSRLFEPINLGSLLLKNRLVMTAMSTRFAGSNGEVTNRLTEYYAARAAGGVGLVTAEESRSYYFCGADPWKFVSSVS